MTVAPAPVHMFGRLPDGTLVGVRAGTVSPPVQPPSWHAIYERVIAEWSDLLDRLADDD